MSTTETTIPQDIQAAAEKYSSGRRTWQIDRYYAYVAGAMAERDRVSVTICDVARRLASHDVDENVRLSLAADLLKLVSETAEIAEREKPFIVFSHYPLPTEATEFEKKTAPEWFAEIPSMPGTGESAKTQSEALHQLMISLEVKLAFDYGLSVMPRVKETAEREKHRWRDVGKGEVPQFTQDVNFIATNGDCIGRVLAGKYIGAAYRCHTFASPLVCFTARYWQPMPEPPAPDATIPNNDPNENHGGC